MANVGVMEERTPSWAFRVTRAGEANKADTELSSEHLDYIGVAVR
jgi:hypothetical protein